MLAIFAVQILLVCLLHDVEVAANPVASTGANGCSCSDVKDITSETALKLEEYIDQSMDSLLDSVDAVVSKSISLAVREELESILHSYTSTNDNQLVLGRLENMTVQQMVNFDGVKLQIEAIRNEMGKKIEDMKIQQMSLVNSTLKEFRMHFEQLKLTKPDKNESFVENELRSEIGDIKNTVNTILELQQQSQGRPLVSQPAKPTESGIQQATVPISSGAEISTLKPLEITSSAELLMGSYEHPVNSCRDLPKNYPSGDYFLLHPDGWCNKIPVFCDMTRTACNITGGWNRIAMLDMTNSSHSCPSSLRLITRDTSPERLCGSVTQASCRSTVFKTHGIQYSRVCGRIKGYQYGSPYAFYYQHSGINSFYIDGVSLTYGRPRKHIWSFVTGSDETERSSAYNCPCTRTDLTWGGTVPDFVGNNYFCDTANHDKERTTREEFYDDPLWDGNGCVSTSSCCCHNNPPWFCAELPESTTDDVELRLCTIHYLFNGDTHIEAVELYVQ